MLLIRCPWCGARDHVEYTYGGDATRQWPSADITDQQWLDWLYLRDNPRGAHVEWWHHTSGCRQWIKVKRDTLTHAISATAPADQALDRG